MRGTGIKKHGCGNRVNRKRTQHDIRRFLGFFSIDMVQTGMGLLVGGILSSSRFGMTGIWLGRIGARSRVAIVRAVTREVARLATGEASRLVSTRTARGSRTASIASTSRTRR